MEVGWGAPACGTSTVVRHFWHYESVAGRSTRKDEYVGRVDSTKARADLLRRMAAYHDRAAAEFARKRARIERLVALASHTYT